jgi:hypothetical protein
MEVRHASEEASFDQSATVAGVAASVLLGLTGLTLSPAPARAVVYCQYVGYPHGCVARAGVVLRPRPVARAAVRHNAGGNLDGRQSRWGAAVKACFAATSEKEAVTASSRWPLFYRPGAGRRPIADGITSSRHHPLERASAQTTDKTAWFNASTADGQISPIREFSVASQFEVFGRLLCRKCSTAPSI